MEASNRKYMSNVEYLLRRIKKDLSFIRNRFLEYEKLPITKWTVLEHSSKLRYLMHDHLTIMGWSHLKIWVEPRRNVTDVNIIVKKLLELEERLEKMTNMITDEIKKQMSDKYIYAPFTTIKEKYNIVDIYEDILRTIFSFKYR